MSWNPTQLYRDKPAEERIKSLERELRYYYKKSLRLEYPNRLRIGPGGDLRVVRVGHPNEAAVVG